MNLPGVLVFCLMFFFSVDLSDLAVLRHLYTKKLFERPGAHEEPIFSLSLQPCLRVVYTPRL